MFKYYCIYKPYGMICGFTTESKDKTTLGSLFNFDKDVYPIGRLDTDSEGLLLLTNDRQVTNKLLHPSNLHKRTYLVQVDQDITEDACTQLARGVEFMLEGKKYKTMPCEVEKVTMPPDLPERNPPVRFRKNIPTSWIKISLSEGKNRQVRKMTAAVGFPTLRLIRIAIEAVELGNMKPGEVREIPKHDFYRLLKLSR